jgi:DNA-binding NarL/FixJ family response regulator
VLMPIGPSDEDRILLSLFLAGLTDLAIADQLGLSVRTVQRRLRRLMDLAGVSTRMQLGWHASRSGWLGWAQSDLEQAAPVRSA